MKQVLLAIFLTLCLSARVSAQQTGAHTISVTETAANIATDATCSSIQCYSVVIKENSASPTGVFNVTPTGSTTAIAIPAGGSFEFDASPNRPFQAGQTLGKIVSTTSGPFTVVIIESPARVSNANAATPGGSSGGGVSSFNTLTGAVTISAGSNITLTPSGNNIAIAASGGSGPTATCDASTVSNYAPAVCVQTFDAAQLNAFHATPLSVIATPGASKAIVPSGSIYAEYIASTQPFGAASAFVIGYGPTLTESFGFPYSGTLDFTNAANQFTVSAGNVVGVTGPQSDAANSDFYLGLSTNIGTGPIATTTLNAGGIGYAANDTGTVSTGNSDATYIVNTVSAGNSAIVSVNSTPNPAGSGYAVNDTGVLTHGSGTAAYIVDSVTTTGSVVTVIPVTAGPGHNYVVNDTGTINGGGSDATYLITSIDSEAITAVNQGTKTFTVAGDQTNTFQYGGFSVIVSGSTGNDNTYTLVSSTFTGGNTNIVVSQAIVSPVADGHISMGAITGISVTAPGTGYSTGVTQLTNGGGQPGSGADANVNVTAISAGVATFHLTSFGTGYSIETGSPTATGGGQPGSGTGFAIDISSVSAGIVTSYTITGDGTGYATGTGVATSTGGGQPGSGTGLLLNITGVTKGNGSAKVVIPFTVVPTS